MIFNLTADEELWFIHISTSESEENIEQLVEWLEQEQWVWVLWEY